MKLNRYQKSIYPDEGTIRTGSRDLDFHHATIKRREIYLYFGEASDPERPATYEMIIPADEWLRISRSMKQDPVSRQDRTYAGRNPS